MSERTFTLCKFSFIPYPHNEKNPRFALGADIYANAHFDKLKKYGDKQHALAIWLDIETQEFVVRKEYQEQMIQSFNINGSQGVMLSNKSTNHFQEAYRGEDFQKALDHVTILAHKYCDHETRWVACTHYHESYCCKKYKNNHAYRGE